MEAENITKSFKNYFQKSATITKNVETIFEKNLNDINQVKSKKTCSQMEVKNLIKIFEKQPQEPSQN